MSLTLACPEIVYHYTTAEGLFGIVRSSELWATFANYLNDTREFVHAFQLLSDEATARLASRSLSPATSEILTMLTLVAADTNFQEQTAGGAAVASFSVAGDSLSQWRAYGGGAGGYAIGFSGQDLFKQSRPDAKSSYFLPCIYDPDQQRKFAHAMVDLIVSRTTSAVMDDVDWFAEAERELWTRILSAGLKDPAFSEEEEWRFVVTNPDDEHIRFRLRGQTVVPYVPVDISLVPIREVRIGPTVNAPRALHSVSLFLKAHGHREAVVAASEVPYRNW